MIFVTGGKYEGEEEFSKTHWPSKKIISDFDEKIKALVKGLEPDEAESAAKKLAMDFSDENKDSVIILTEAGCGIIPLSKDDRIFREAVGRAGCFLAEKADEVFLVTMGIGTKIK